MTFKVGDRIKANFRCEDFYPAGATGTVSAVIADNPRHIIYIVDFDPAQGVKQDHQGTWKWSLSHPLASAVATAPTARKNDPATSKGKKRVNKYEQAVLTVISGGYYEPRPQGWTGKELAAETGHPLNCITPRFAPLRRKGLIKPLTRFVDGTTHGRPEEVARYESVKRDKQIVWVLA